MRKTFITCGLLAVGLALVLSVLNLRHGNLNQDEGWYLYAAKSVAAGKVPYRDFAYTQAPVLPFVYASLYSIVEKNGVAGGRLITTGFGLLAALLAAGLAGRSAGKHKLATAIAAFLFIACNTYQSYFTTIVKTYGLCSFLLMAGLFLLTCRKNHLLGGTACCLSGALLALAAGTRISAGIVLPIVGIWLILQSRDKGIRREDYASLGQFIGHKFSWVCFGIGGGLMLLLLFLPGFLNYPEQISFGLFGYHAGRDPGGLKDLLMLKVGFISRFVQAYFLFAILTLSVVFLRGRQPRQSGNLAPLLWSCGIAITAVHFLAPFPYDDYQAIAFPFLAAALALSLMQGIDHRRIPLALVFLLFASVAGAFSSPINQEWFVRGRDRIWWQFKEKSDLKTLRDAATFIRENSPEGSTLLTQDTYLAIEANRNVPSGMEMGPFSYYPDMPREQAEKLHLLNKEMLLETLEKTEAPLAALSGYSLSIESPAIAEVGAEDAATFHQVLQERYSLVEEIPHFGQAHSELALWKRKPGR